MKRKKTGFLARLLQPIFAIASDADLAEPPSQGISIGSFHWPTREAVVSQVIRPGRSGRVRFANSWWPAQCVQDRILKPGTVVRVMGRRDLTLMVEPVPETADLVPPGIPSFSELQSSAV